MALSKQEERTDSREPNLRQTPDSHGWKCTQLTQRTGKHSKYMISNIQRAVEKLYK